MLDRELGLMLYWQLGKIFKYTLSKQHTAALVA
jgi:hypothetical protein